MYVIECDRPMLISCLKEVYLLIVFWFQKLQLAGLDLRTVSLDAILGAHAAASKEL